MCGIVGAFRFGSKKLTKTKRKLIDDSNIFVTTQLLEATVERGKEATGVSLIFEDGNYQGLKMGVDSPSFINRYGGKETDYDGFLSVWRGYESPVRTYIGHCRKPSNNNNNAHDNNNNHPIRIEDTMIVHNGTLDNDEIIFEKLGSKRDGEVDSEAIARLVHYYTKNGTIPFTTDMLDEIVTRLVGSFSVIAASGNNPYQVAMFRDFRPAELLLVKPLSTVFVASEKKWLENVTYEYNKMAHLFATEKKFPILKKEDVELVTMADASALVWDLTIDVTPETELKDLYDWKKVTATLKNDRKWQSGAKKTTTTTTQGTKGTSTNVGAGATGSASKVGTEVNAGPKSDTQTGSKSEVGNGLVWSDSLNRYKTQANIEKSKLLSNVEIDAETGNISLVNKDMESSSVAHVKEVEESVEDLITDPATVKEVAMIEADNATQAIGFTADVKKTNDRPLLDYKPSKSERDSEPKSSMMVDMSSDSEAHKRAAEFVEKDLVLFSDEEECANELDVQFNVLNRLPVHALANRILKYVAKKYYYLGYVARKSEEPNKPIVDISRAEQNMRVLKMINSILSKVVNDYAKHTHSIKNEDKLESFISDAMEKLVKNKRCLPKEVVGRVLSSGDLKKSPVMEKLITYIEKL